MEVLLGKSWRGEQGPTLICRLGRSSYMAPERSGRPLFAGPWESMELQHEILMGYPLVNIQKAIENGHRNSGFSH